MKLKDRLAAFSRLGDQLRSLNANDIEALAGQARAANGWFTPESIEQAIKGIALMLEAEKLEKWTAETADEPEIPKIVGIVMAGNIPMVGFHDLLCVLISGHVAAVKLSSQDKVLVQQIIDWLVEIEPRFKRNIEVRERLDQVEVVIATGSDNTARYFEYYFGKYPHIIRKNRTSVAILDGTETPHELALLGADIFSYFGLGCRNVSKVFTPVDFDIREAFPHFEPFSFVANHNKYRNNYDYNKSILLVNQVPHLDTGFLLIQTTEALVSPPSILYHQAYEAKSELLELLKASEEKIQCIVGHDHLPFGTAQSPELWDYADGVDVMAFLKGI